MPKVYVISPGILCTVQDAGRYGFLRYGMPATGAMDEISMRIANRLVGNAPDAAVLEATLQGPSLVFEKDTYIAIAGAEMPSTLDGHTIPSYQTVRVKAGDVLQMGKVTWGARAYIAVAGGFRVPEVMGSRSTFLSAGVGGLEGRPLQKGDKLEYLCIWERIKAVRIPDEFLSWLRRDGPLLIYPGPELHRFTREAVFTLLTNPYTISAESNRMGYRLEGPALNVKKGLSADIVSTGVLPGTIQVPGDGKPVLLMADAQTTGGYCRLALLAKAEISRAAQLKPGDSLRFGEAQPEQAKELIKRCTMF